MSKNIRENYTYFRNQPKDQPIIRLNPLKEEFKSNSTVEKYISPAGYYYSDNKCNLKCDKVCPQGIGVL
jgi:hypothetical protein